MRTAPSDNPAPSVGVTQGRPAVLGKRWMVSSSHYLASQAGAQMFERGGNAIDAGVASGIALNVLERHLTDFGGVAPIILFRPGMDGPETIDGLGRWPAKFSLDEYRRRYGDDMPIGIPRSVTPAAVDAWLTALARHGTLTLEQVLAPNIELAEGFPVYPRLARAIAMLEERLQQWPTSAAVFLPGGRAPRAGEILVQEDLASLFRLLVQVERSHSSLGRAAAIMAARDVIYTGQIAEQIARSHARRGGGPSPARTARGPRPRQSATRGPMRGAPERPATCRARPVALARQIRRTAARWTPTGTRSQQRRRIRVSGHRSSKASASSSARAARSCGRRPDIRR